MDLSKFQPHVAEAFRKFGEARYQDGLRDGKQAGRDEVMSGLNALRAFLPPTASAPPLPGLTGVGITPVMLSQPPVDSADGDTDPRADARGGEGGDDEFDLDGLVRELAGADDPQVRQQVLALAWTAVVEAYKENGKDPAPVLARLMEMARGGAVEAATDPDAEVWLGWQRQDYIGRGGQPKIKAVGTDEHQGKVLYGAQAEAKLRAEGKRGKQAEARARRDDLVAKLDPASGELFDEQDWDDFSGHLENLTGAELKELRQKIKSTLQDRANRGLLKAGKNKQVRVQNLQEGVKNLIRHAIERAELPDAGLDENEGKISNLIGSMGGIRPDDPDFQRLTGFSPREAVENGILPRSAVKKNGKRFLDLASAFKEEGHLYVQDQADGSAGDYDAALAEAILDGKKTANTDVYDSEKRWAEVMGRKSVADRLKLARLRRSDPAEFERQKRAMMGEPEAGGGPDPDEYADYLNMQDEAADEQVPEAETPAAPEFDPASVFDDEPSQVPADESVAETPAEQPDEESLTQQIAEKPEDAELRRILKKYGGRVANMSGDRAANDRQRVIELMTGQKQPKAKSGVNAVQDLLYKRFGNPANSSAANSDAVEGWTGGRAVESMKRSEGPAEVPVEGPVADTPTEQPAEAPAEKPVDQTSPETPPAPAKPASVPPVDPVPARPQAEVPPAEKPESELTDEEWEERFQAEMAAERKRRQEQRGKNIDVGLADEILSKPRPGQVMTEQDEQKAAIAAQDARDGGVDDELGRAMREADADPDGTAVPKGEADRLRRLEEMAANIEAGRGIGGEELSGEDADVDAESMDPATEARMTAATNDHTQNVHDELLRQLSNPKRKNGVTLTGPGGERVRYSAGDKSLFRVKDNEGLKTLEVYGEWKEVDEDGERVEKSGWRMLSPSELAKMGEDLAVDLPDFNDPKYDAVAKAAKGVSAADELADTDTADSLAASDAKQAAKGKPGKPSLANKKDLPFAQRLAKGKGNSPAEAANKAAKAFARTNEVPPVPDVVRKAFANAPDKDELDVMWEQHVRQLAGEGVVESPAGGPPAKRTGTKKATGGGPKLLTANEMASWQPAGEFDTREEAEAAGGQGVAQSGGKWYAMNPRASAAESPPPQPETAPQTPQDDPEDIRSQIAALQAKLAASQKGGSAPRADAPPPPRAELEKAVRNEVKDGLAGEFANIRMVPIHKIRDTVRAKYGDAAASPAAFNDLLLDLRRDKVVKLVSIDDRSRATPEQLRDSVFAVGETFFYVEKGPNWNE